MTQVVGDMRSIEPGKLCLAPLFQSSNPLNMTSKTNMTRRVHSSKSNSTGSEPMDQIAHWAQ